MADNEKVRQKTEGDPVEKPKILPAAFPEKFDTEQKQKNSPDDKKLGKGARFHGSM
jgi:hypothetical protein